MIVCTSMGKEGQLYSFSLFKFYEISSSKKKKCEEDEIRIMQSTKYCLKKEGS
jgi:hypothetical protein